MVNEIVTKIEEVSAAYDVSLAGATAKIGEDFVELSRQIAELTGGNPEALAALDTFKTKMQTTLGAIDPVPEFPPAAPTA